VRKLLHILYTAVASLFLLFLMAVWVTSVSPIYSFRAPQPFQGPDIFNPYSALDTVQGWKRANFHTHTRVKGPFPPNECEAWPQETYDTYRKLGYDIVTFSNHNELTTHPFDPQLQVNVYEQGYSPFKFHKLVFGSPSVTHWDPLLPILTSQMQFELDYLGRSSDFIQINHPYRTIGLTETDMKALSGYEIMELDTHVSTQNEYWDQALSAGHYSFGLANDDLHHARSAERIAIRCNFLCTPSARYEDLKNTLLGGCYYAMRVPNYGDGDWEEKMEKNQNLPAIRSIGVAGDTLYMALTAQADSIRVNGQNHATLLLARDTDGIEFKLGADEPFARFTAYFPGGEVIYTNPFARYDASVAANPFNNAPQKVNVLMTVLFNLLVLALVFATAYLFIKLYKKK